MLLRIYLHLAPTTLAVIGLLALLGGLGGMVVSNACRDPLTEWVLAHGAWPLSWWPIPALLLIGYGVACLVASVRLWLGGARLRAEQAPLHRATARLRLLVIISGLLIAVPILSVLVGSVAGIRLGVLYRLGCLP